MTTSVLAYIPSPSQGVWELGPLPIRAYALFIITGIIVALLIGDRRWVARGGEPGVIYDIVLWAVPFGLIGGRLYHVITDWRKYFGEDGAGLVGALRIWDGGLGIWGAVALGGVGAWIGCRRRGIPLPAFGDAIAPGIVLAQAIGRLGNYFNQELYGRPTTLPWGLEIYERRNAAGILDNLNGVSTGQLEAVVHPTFLYELLWNLLIFAALILIDRRFRIGHGRLFAMYVAGYCLGRFWIELMRSDPAQLLAGIRVNSFTATFVFIGAVVYIILAPKGREDPASLKGTAETGDAASVEDVVREVAVAPSAGVIAAAKAAEAEAADKKVAPDVAGQAEPSAEEATAGVVEPVKSEVDRDPDAELAAELAHAAEVMAAEADRRAVGVGAVEPDEVVAAAEADVESPAGEVEAGQPAGAARPHRTALFDAEADAELAAALARAAEVMAGLACGGAEAGIGAVEVEEAAAAAEDAPVVHEAAVEGEAEADRLVGEAEGEDLGADEAVAEADSGEPGPKADVAEAADEDSRASDEMNSHAPTQAPSHVTSPEAGGRLRQWLRRRRDR